MTEETAALIRRTIVVTKLTDEEVFKIDRNLGAVWQVRGHLDGRFIAIDAHVSRADWDLWQLGRRDLIQLGKGTEPKPLINAIDLVAKKMAEIIRFGWPQPTVVTP